MVFVLSLVSYGEFVEIENYFYLFWSHGNWPWLHHLCFFCHPSPRRRHPRKLCRPWPYQKLWRQSPQAHQPSSRANIGMEGFQVLRKLLMRSNHVSNIFWNIILVLRALDFEVVRCSDSWSCSLLPLSRTVTQYSATLSYWFSLAIAVTFYTNTSPGEKTEEYVRDGLVPEPCVPFHFLAKCLCPSNSLP